MVTSRTRFILFFFSGEVVAAAVSYDADSEAPSFSITNMLIVTPEGRT